MKNKIILLVIVGMFLLTLVSAATTLGTFQQGECIQLIQTCGDCTYNNISNVLYPNSSVAISNVTMEKDDTYYNYTFCNTSTTGVYIVHGFGDLGGEKTSWVYNFEITPSGKLGVLIFLAIFAFAFIGLGIGLKIPSLGFIGSILLVLAGMYTMIYGLCDVSNLYTRGIAISLLGLGIIFMISSAYEWFAWGEEG